MALEYYDKRKVLLIDPEFQLSIIKKFFILQAVITIVVLTIFLWQFTPLLAQAKSLTLPETHPFVIAFDKFQFMLIACAVCLSIFLGCAFYLAALTISNRIAGPLYHLKKHLKEIRENEEKPESFSHLSFRRNDYFHAIAEEVNHFLDCVHKK